MVLGFVVVFLSFDTEVPEGDTSPVDVIIMAEPQNVTVVPNQGDNKYIKRAIFIEKIRNTLRLNPIPEPELTPEPAPAIISAPEPQPEPQSQPNPTPVIVPVPESEPVATNTPTSTQDLLISNSNDYVDNQATSTP